MGAFAGKAASVLATRISIFGLSLVSSVLLARFLGPIGKGQLSVLETFVGIVSLIACPGVGAASVYLQNRKKQSQWSIASSAILLQVGLALAGILVAMVIIEVVPGVERIAFHGQVAHSIAFLALSMLPIVVLFAAIQYVFLGMNALAEYNILSFGMASAQLAFYALGLIFLRLGVAGAIIATGAASLVMGVWGYVRLRREGFRFEPSTRWTKDLVDYGVKSWLGTIMQFFNYRLDTLIVNFFVGVAAVGLYSIAVALAETLWYISAAASTVLFPRTASDVVAAAKFTPLVSRNVALVTLICAAGLALVCYPLIRILFGQEFVPAAGAVIALLPGIIMLGVGKVLASDLNGRGKPAYGSWAALCALTATLLLDFLLIPRMGFLGAAIASSISYGLSGAVLLIFYVRVSGNSVRAVLLPQASDLKLYTALVRRGASTLRGSRAGWQR